MISAGNTGAAVAAATLKRTLAGLTGRPLHCDADSA